ncbi:MAG TPA: alpha/beta hydrolase [Allosphingosinicella sp.]
MAKPHKALLGRCLASAALAFAAAALAPAAAPAHAYAAPPPTRQPDATSDDALVRTLPGFRRGHAPANGVTLHYVEGGTGDAVLLLPGWPQTWWSYRKVMPALAARYRVIAVDIRGMGGSDKPAGGYDKKTMAADIHALMRHLGLRQAHIVGHDIGAQVAFSFAANHPEATRTLTLLDVAHPDEELLKWPLLPRHGTFGPKIDEDNAYAWWFAFHQVKGLPEDLLEGRAHIEHEWFYRYLLKDEAAIGPHDRAVYAKAYGSRDAIRAGNAWYQAFTQDIIDDGTYARLRMPVLGVAGPGYGWLKSNLERKAVRPRVVKLVESGHFIAEEQPQELLRHLFAFLDGSGGSADSKTDGAHKPTQHRGASRR